MLTTRPTYKHPSSQIISYDVMTLFWTTSHKSKAAIHQYHNLQTRDDHCSNSIGKLLSRAYMYPNLVNTK